MGWGLGQGSVGGFRGERAYVDKISKGLRLVRFFVYTGLLIGMAEV